MQAGGGVVADSNGLYEYNESANKAKAVLNAIAAAETLVRLRPVPVAMADTDRERRGKRMTSPGPVAAGGGQSGAVDRFTAAVGRR